MFKFTCVTRQSDALPLAASVDEDKSISEYKSQAKQIAKQLSAYHPPRLMTIAAGPFSFHVLTEKGVCFLTLCEKSYAAKLVFSYLEELAKEFNNLYGDEVEKVERPYPFIKFDNFIQKTRRVYLDTRTKSHFMTQLTDELQDVQNIVRKNIQEVLGRGERLETVSKLSSAISHDSKQFKLDATHLNRMHFWRTYGPVFVVLFIVLLVLLIRFWFY